MNELPRQLTLPKIYCHTPTTTQVLEIGLVNRPVGGGDLLSPSYDGNCDALTKGNALEARLTKLFTISNNSNYRSAQNSASYVVSRYPSPNSVKIRLIVRPIKFKQAWSLCSDDAPLTNASVEKTGSGISSLTIRL